MLIESNKVMDMISKVIADPNADMGKFKMLMDWRNEMFDKAAEIEFNAAMSRVQGQLPLIIKDKWNDQTKSYYDQLGSIIKELAPIYGREGFALSVNMIEPRIVGWYTFEAELTHASGHKKFYQVDLPPDIAGQGGNRNKTDLHGFGSSLAYGRRYFHKMIFNLPAEDDDGNAGGGDVREPPKKQPQRQPPGQKKVAPAEQKAATGKAGMVDQNQIGLLRNRLKRHNKTEADLCKALEITKIEDMPATGVDDAVAWITQ
jgi:hypothetical protein